MRGHSGRGVFAQNSSKLPKPIVLVGPGAKGGEVVEARAIGARRWPVELICVRRECDVVGKRVTGVRIQQESGMMK